MKIVAVIVRYGIALSDSLTYASIMKCGLPVDVTLFVYDNSPAPITAEEKRSLPGEYSHDPKNGGLAAAYNAALVLAKFVGARWLLLLDQDTGLPEGYLDRLGHTLDDVERDEAIAAVVPRVCARSTVVSPSVVRRGWRLAPLAKGESGRLSGGVTAINSGAAVRVSFLERIGGFDGRFRLDYLDHWLFRMIERASRRVFVTGELLAHDLSIQDLGAKVSEARYRSILDGESLFFREFGTAPEKLLYSVRLLRRAAKQAVDSSTRLHAAMTASQFLATCGFRASREK